VKIGALADATGTSTRSLRYYEQQGLLEPVRTAGNQRDYGDDAIERVTLIVRLLAAGLSTATIYDVLPCVTDPTIRTPALAARLRHELDRVETQLVALTGARQVLVDLVDHYEVP
jgi:DNA-binding transcriptional MerR regulator